MHRFFRLYGFIPVICCVGSFLISRAESPVQAADLGTRPGSAGAGTAVAGVRIENFARAQSAFKMVHSISGDIEPGRGLGPRFNGTSCGACHSYPATGGSSPPQNPQLEMAAAYGAQNKIPTFLKEHGPILAVRVKSAVGRAEPGEVLQLFTVNGRTDAHRCAVPAPDFSNPENLSFRIPTPVFGAGLIDNIGDAEIVANRDKYRAAKLVLGIHGEPNFDSEGAVGKFGWKAQHHSLLQFTEDAYETEIGVRGENSDYRHEALSGPCYSVYDAPYDDPYFSPSYENEEPPVLAFEEFMRGLKPPEAVSAFSGATTESIRNGRRVFDRVGCALCHSPSLRTGNASDLSALNNQDVPLFSDLCLHRMGPKLADGIAQGHAGPDQFRTAPLWGIGQRMFFLHDGRTADLLVAIQEHASEGEGHRSEANAVIDEFNRLNATERQNLLNFLRSL